MPGPLVLLSGATTAMGASQGVMSFWPPLQEKLNQFAWDKQTIRIPSLAELVMTRRVGIINDQQFYSLAKANGYEKNYAKEFLDATESLPSAMEFVTLFWRGKLNSQQFFDRMERLGFSKTSAQEALDAAEYMPGPSDLVRFAVRDVYSPQIRGDYGLDQDFPSEFLKASAQAGLSEEFAKQYWAAHWELPSLTQGYEMFHRRIINEEQLKALMKSQDVMPFWRDKLIQMNFHPFTRVDVRRMYKLGTLNREQVIEAYQDIGYNVEKATQLADFIQADIADDSTGITISSLFKSYKRDIITREELIAHLQTLGMNEGALAYQLEVADFEKAEAELDELVEELEARYMLGLIDEAGIRTALTTEGASNAFVAKVIAKITIKQSKKMKTLSKSDYERLLTKDVITEKMFFDGLVKIGYSETDAFLLLSEEQMDKQDVKRKFMPVETYAKWLKLGIMKEPIFKATLSEMGFEQGDINRKVQEVFSAVSKSN
jgi:hypothetical protein